MARRDLMIQKALVDNLLIAAQNEELPKDNRTPRQVKKDWINNQKLDREDIKKRRDSEGLDWDQLTDAEKEARQQALDALRRGDVSQEEINEGLQREDMKEGNFLQSSFNWRTLLKIMQFIPEVVGSGLGINTYRP